MNGIQTATEDLTLDEYRELAEFGHRVRCFESQSERNAEAGGSRAGSYPLLLAIQGLPEGARPTISALAHRLCMPVQATSRLVNDAVATLDLIRSSVEGDGNEDWVKLTRTGREKLRKIATANREDLEQTGPELLNALQVVMRQRRRRGRGLR